MDQSKRYTISGKKQYTLKELLNKIEEAHGKDINSTQLVQTPSPTELSHDGNMIKMAEYFDAHPELAKTLKDNDYYKRIGSAPKLKFDNVYQKGAFSDAKLDIPAFADYKQSVLD